MITPAQKRMLHAAARQLQLTRDQYESILMEHAGVHSSNDLDNEKFDRVMRHMERLGFDNYVRPQRNAAGAITKWQLIKIQAMYRELGWNDRARQVGFNKRQCAAPWPQTRQQANQVIEGLKALVTRKGRAPSPKVAE